MGKSTAKPLARSKPLAIPARHGPKTFYKPRLSLQDAFWIEGWVDEVFRLTHHGWEPAKDSSDGYPIGIRHPLFSYPLFHDGNVIGHIRGPGPASLLKRYGQRKRSIKSGAPLGKGTGVFLGRSVSRMDESPAGWRAVTGSCQRFTALVAKSLVTARMQDEHPPITLARLIPKISDKENLY